MIFGLDKIPQGRLKYDPRFRKHTALISKSFDFAVKNLNFVEKLAQHFHVSQPILIQNHFCLEPGEKARSYARSRLQVKVLEHFC
jgi:hypothetical protein